MTLRELRIKAYETKHGREPHKYFASTFKVKPPKTAAQLEALIDEYCTLTGAECTKVYSGGRRMVTRTAVRDVMGRSNTITDDKWIPGTTRAGTSDLIIMKGQRGFYCEVKFSRSDRQSEVQKHWQARVEKFGCRYVIVRTLEEFINEYKKHDENKRI